MVALRGDYSNFIPNKNSFVVSEFGFKQDNVVLHCDNQNKIYLANSQVSNNKLYWCEIS